MAISQSPALYSELILLVNDDPARLDSIGDLLSPDGYSLLKARSAERALQMMQTILPDLVISEVIISGIDGIELCRRIKSDSVTEGIPVLLVSGLRYDDASVIEGLEAGADDYLEIDAPPSLLVKKVGRLMARARANQTRLKYETALKESEERFSKAFNASPVPMSITTYEEGRYIDVNESFLQNTGYGREEIIGRTVTDINLFEDPEERDRLMRILKEHGRIRNAEVRRRVKSGEVRVALASSEIISLERGQCVLTTINDITDRRGLEEQFLHSQKLESVGRLAGGVAHDFNNLLTAIIGYSQLLIASFDKSDPRYAHAEEIENAGKRAATLTNQLLAFSRKQVIKPQPLNLNAVVTNIETMLRRVIGEDIELATALRQGVGSVIADPGQIEQVLMNLAVNARDAMPQGGKLIIETANTDLDENYERDHIGVEPGRYVMLAVSDSGCGMDKETQARIFEPFFTTKELGKGTGLGLSTVYGIVKQSGGNIWVYSEPDRGTTFKIYLPFVDGDAEPIRKIESVRNPATGEETILLVEDEIVVRKFTREILEMNGYTVLEAASGEEALLIAQEYDKAIDMLVTDVVMPQIGGRALANAIGITRPRIKVLYLSGYTDETMVQHGLLERATAFLQKPFTPQMLASKVREVLDDKSDGENEPEL